MGLPVATGLPRLICCLMPFLFMRIRGTTTQRERGDEEESSPELQHPPLLLCYRHLGLGTQGCLRKPPANVWVTQTRCRKRKGTSLRARESEGIYKSVRRFRPQCLPTLRETGRVSRKTRREALLHGVPRRKGTEVNGRRAPQAPGVGKVLVWFPGTQSSALQSRAPGPRGRTRWAGPCLV